VESATAERKAATAEAPVLYHIEISHYSEKARWALDYKGIAHVRRAPPPLLHMAWALWLTRRPTFPVLRLDGVRVGDSTRIIETLEREHPEPPLYPPDAGERRLLPPPLPAAVERFRAEASGRRAFEWVKEMYRRHRGRSTEIPG
jgi:glutathione S-transferase